jgi:hypothetical protein
MGDKQARWTILQGSGLVSATGDFQRDLRQSGTDSIDSFLARSKEYGTIGKHVIAFLISAFENESYLHEPDKLDVNKRSDFRDWHKYLFNSIMMREEYLTKDLFHITSGFFHFQARVYHKLTGNVRQRERRASYRCKCPGTRVDRKRGNVLRVRK